MRLFLLAAVFASVCTARSGAAQSASAQSATTNSAQERIALSSRPAASAESPRRMKLACAPLSGQVFEANGRPLLGATLLIKGTHQVYVTNGDGQFDLTDTVYQGQVLTVQAAGYTTQEIPLNDCTLPRLVLEKAPDARIKRNGKRAGQVLRLNHRNTNLK
jgi:guanyl-specific ribonuclease Sa